MVESVVISVDKLSSLIDTSKSLNALRRNHAIALRRGLSDHTIVSFKLQRSYSSHGRLDLAETLFRRNPNPNIFLYTSLIHSHANSGDSSAAISLFSDMLSAGISPNAFALSAALKACSSAGRGLHGLAVKLGFDSDSYVRTALISFYASFGESEIARQLLDEMPERVLAASTAMIACYARAGRLVEARGVFEEVPGLERDRVCWNAMIDGYVRAGKPDEALSLFREMIEMKVRPGEAAVVSALSACGIAGAEDTGRWVHAYVANSRFEITARLGTALIDMYCKCGALEEAIEVFEGVREKDVVAWNSMISGLATHGLGHEAIRVFERMKEAGHRPTDVTLIAVLSACANAGLVDEGREVFGSMRERFGIEPKVEHYGCFVNLLSRAGKLDEAFELVVKQMGLVEPDPVLWGTLLGACKIHGRADLGEEIAKMLVDRGVANSGTYIILSNIYSARGDWEGAARVRGLMRESGIRKEPGCSSIEVDNRVYEFVAGDKNHPKSREIYAMLEEINGWLKDCGYTPRTDVVLHDLGERQKEQSLEVHSERIAIAFGLISTRPGTGIKIVKNLRVCQDCHAVTKLISKITGRRIVMRDRNRFHHFENGMCSCGDYW